MQSPVGVPAKGMPTSTWVIEPSPANVMVVNALPQTLPRRHFATSRHLPSRARTAAALRNGAPERAGAATCAAGSGIDVGGGAGTGAGTGAREASGASAAAGVLGWRDGSEETQMKTPSAHIQKSAPAMER